MKQADIVVTNPPFSKFRDYLLQLIKYKKKFIILGNINATATKDIFPLFQTNQCWFGANDKKGSYWFVVPENQKYDKIIEETGQKLKSFGNICWFTNLPHESRNKKLILWAKYDNKTYPKLDNYDAIEVSKTREIPLDYDGIMAVPISFLNKYNPDQFEILGMDMWTKEPIRTKVYYSPSERYLNGASVLKQEDGTYVKKFKRILIRRKQ